LAAKTLQDMGMSNVCHLRDGFHAWQDAGGEVVEKPPRYSAD
jgi:rhodanese-related sulfurtransferase